ncbi:endocuticle structural glycoprotein SgAbd-3 [Cotesia typhae]|uniref:endocuticle structural glycoprotein SgAbd-3 n=1 Tax=Cotesia typhae TaxID=2053667 RepID=UPI003D68AFCD
MNGKVVLSFLLLVAGISAQRGARPGARPPVPSPQGGSPPVPPTQPQQGSKDDVTIVHQEQDISPDGTFSSSWETSDGSTFSETGGMKTVGENATQTRQGSVSWTAPDGTKINLSWTADENGVVFAGDHLPTPPPTQAIPEAIQRSLEWIAKNPSPDANSQ